MHAVRDVAAVNSFLTACHKGLRLVNYPDLSNRHEVHHYGHKCGCRKGWYGTFIHIPNRNTSPNNAFASPAKMLNTQIYNFEHKEKHAKQANIIHPSILTHPTQSSLFSTTMLHYTLFRNRAPAHNTGAKCLLILNPNKLANHRIVVTAMGARRSSV
jgi:hypothetical protein